jgi:D-glucosaminate-6-phosphate ammonia-lyase
MNHSTGSAIFDRLGLERVINGRGWITVVGGSIMPAEVVSAMTDAVNTYVDLDELNLAAGREIARYTGAESGLVVAGAAAGLLLQAAACIAGDDPVLIDQLPDSTGLRNEVLLHEKHRTNYDRCYRAAGAKLVIWGGDDRPAEEQLTEAMGQNTAALAYVFHPWNSCPISLEKAVSMAHDRDIPVIVDAAVTLPPATNLTRYIDQGADMVTYSGGKGLRGPQSTGILCGRGDLIEAARLNNSPFKGVGRSAKVCKEEIAGLLAALDLFVRTDHEAVWAEWRNRSSVITSAVEDITGLEVRIEDGDPNRQGPQAVVYFRNGWSGPDSDTIVARLAAREPSIRIGNGGYEDELFINPGTLEEGEEEIVARALREELLSPR